MTTENGVYDPGRAALVDRRNRQTTFERGVALALATGMLRDLRDLRKLTEGLRWIVDGRGDGRDRPGAGPAAGGHPAGRAHRGPPGGRGGGAMTAPQDIGRLRGQVRVLELATLALMVRAAGRRISPRACVLALRTARRVPAAGRGWRWTTPGRCCPAGGASAPRGWAMSAVRAARPAERPEARWERIGPDQARALLARNRNRRLYPNTVAVYARAMREGTWHGGNAQTIQVDREGYLRDGQHRLHAVLEVGTPQWFLVVRGVDPEVFPVLDIGAPRSPGDQVGVAADETGDPLLGAGMNSTQQKYAAGAVRLLERLEQTPRLPQPFAGTWAPKERLTAAEVARAFRERWAPEVVAQIPVAERIKSAHLRGGPGLWAAMLVLLHRVDPADCDRFVEQLVTGANLPAGSAVLALRFRLLPAAEGGRESRAPGAMLARVNEVARAIAYGWRAYREGRAISRILVQPELPFPYPE